MSAVARTIILPILVFLQLFIVALWDWWHDLITLQFFLTLRHPNLFFYTIRYIDFWPSTSLHMSVKWVLVLHPCTKYEVRWSPLRKIWCILHLSINRPRGYLYMGSWVTRVMGFVPANFQLAMPFLDLGSGMGERQTDGQTDDSHQHFMPPTWGWGRNKMSALGDIIILPPMATQLPLMRKPLPMLPKGKTVQLCLHFNIPADGELNFGFLTTVSCTNKCISLHTFFSAYTLICLHDLAACLHWSHR